MSGKKKIGLAACYDTKNYGSMLQTLATTQALVQLGYDYEIIRYTRKPTPALIFKSLDRIPEKLQAKVKAMRRDQQLREYPAIRDGIRRRNACFDRFMNETFTKMSPAYDTFEQLQAAARGYEAVVVGSDQLWLPQGYATGFYNLLFVPDEVPKIAYATSFGVSRLPDNKKKAAKHFLERIEHISVRELRGSKIVEQLTGRKVPTAVDPTLLFDAQHWADMIADAPIELSPASGALNGQGIDGQQYIFCYLLGNNPGQRKMAEKLGRETGLPIVTIPHLDEFVECDVTFGDVQLYDVGPAEWVNLVRHARYVCTDSFHGTVFSILHHRQFVTFNRFAEGKQGSRNSRIDSLLKQTGLLDRRVKNQDAADLRAILDTPIDYTRVDRRVQKMRGRSMEYLAQALAESVG